MGFLWGKKKEQHVDFREAAVCNYMIVKSGGTKRSEVCVWVVECFMDHVFEAEQ